MKARLKEQLIGKEVEAQASQIKMKFKKTSKKSEKTSENRLTNKNQCDKINELPRKEHRTEVRKRRLKIE